MLYHLGLLLRDTSLVSEAFQRESHEAVREWYARARCHFQVHAKHRRAIAVDKTSIEVHGEWLYVWEGLGDL